MSKIASFAFSIFLEYLRHTLQLYTQLNNIFQYYIQLRKLVGDLPVAVVARLFGLNESADRNYISGRSLPGFAHALKKADATGVTVDWLGHYA